MTPQKLCIERIARGDASWRGAVGRLARRVRRSVLGLGLAGAVFAASGSAASLWALQISARLTVRPHEMATGTRNAKAGVHELDPDPAMGRRVLAYVSTRAVGTRRVPLVVYLHGGGDAAADILDMDSPFAEKYGMILLALDNTDPGAVDPAMKQVLQKFAIDPDKIALVGGSGGASATLWLGCKNLDIFSRLAPLSPDGPDNANRCIGTDPQNTKVQFFFSGGLGEDIQGMFAAVRQLQQAGYPVKPVLNLREHARRPQDQEYMWTWLHESWTAPRRGARPTPAPAPAAAVADADVALTPQALAQMAEFWAGFMDMPRFIWQTARHAYEKQITIPAGPLQLTVFDMVDMGPLAAKYLSVAAALEGAGLTVQQENAYRAAFIRAKVAKNLKLVTDTAGSVLAKNVAVLAANPKQTATVLDGIIGTTEAMNVYSRWVWGMLVPRECLTDPKRDDCGTPYPGQR